ncbi:hypothetical protein FA15DRAFT_662992 [Coprinopsis marcescibilis]|uniref:Uncharacterized protein n=1 Tax=Coprinopsis marcescibilis TaxID=230819 RepID=A0A5C3LE44_COPMA|nr:hypothetical protein FA15DRAFT_662992 [Coprinopsis marcescibilis]
MSELESFLQNPRESGRKRGINKRWIATAWISLGIVAATGFILSGIWFSSSQHPETTSRLEGPKVDTTLKNPEVLPVAPPVQPVVVEESDPYDSSNFIRGPPTNHFRDNLRPDKKYITTWLSAGWTNDVMTYINLIYLGIITERIPIVSVFTPTHIGNVPPIPFGEVFDIPRLKTIIRAPILEWQEVKKSTSTEIDEIGCWNTWESVQEQEKHPRESSVPGLLSLDISYTKAPSWIKLIPNYIHDKHTTFWSLAALAFPEHRQENLVAPRESKINMVRLPPDEQLACYDYLYYVCANQPFEFEFDYSPAWRFVGQHLHWSSKVMGLVDQYVRRTIGIADGEKTPAWISIHVRHGDFADWCQEVPVSDCFAPLSVIARRVDEVKQELLDTKGIAVDHVIMTSDEKDPGWWEDVRARGWLQVDHSNTVKQHGPWYPVLIDAGIQSSGMGFVGTDRSTMSILARRRVQSWKDGATRTVKWGKPGSDDH